MNKAAIADSALDLQKTIWHLRDVYCRAANNNPLLCLAPEIACRHLGYTYAKISEFGDSRFTKGRVIGQLDMARKSVTVADTMSLNEQKFTAAHEIGHILIHKDHGDMTMHRERPQLGDNKNRPPREKEADYFAACFTMPEKQIKTEFCRRFGPSLPLRIDDRLAWFLAPSNPGQLLNLSKNSLDRELAIARYQGTTQKRFHSLAELFGVSAKAMALRLKELNLVQWP